MKYLKPVIRFFCIVGLLIISLQNNSRAQNSGCGIPANLHITNLNSNGGLLVWNNVNGSIGYIIRYHQSGSSTWRRITSGNNTEAITGLLPNTTYEVKVRSECSQSIGLYTNLYHFTTPPVSACGIPNVYYFTANSTVTANSCVVGWPAINGAIKYVVEYRIRYSNSAWLSDSSLTNSLLLTGLLPTTQYEFRVQTVCNNGYGQFSLSGIFTTHNSNCGAPVNLSAGNITDSSAVLSWDSLNCAVSYKIEYRIAGQTWSSDTTSAITYNLPNLIGGTSYEFRIQSVDSTGAASGYSSTYEFTTTSSACGIPSDLSADSITTSQAVVSWTAVQGALWYNIRYRLAGSGSWTFITAYGDDTLISGLSQDNVYEFQIQAVCSSAVGSYSAQAAFLTLPNFSNHLPVPDHIVVCIIENKAYTQLINNVLTPHINDLANDSMTAVFTDSYGLSHPSQPNYIQLFSGSNQGVTNNVTPLQHFTTPNLARELINAGRTFTEYNEALPSVGFDGSTSGRYQRKHNPLANWMGSGTNQVSSVLNQPFSNFPTNYNNLPTVSFVVPDMINSMHDGILGTALATGDDWIYDNMFPYIQWARTHNSLFILTTDEDDGNHNNRILTLMTGEMVNEGNFSQTITHYSILRTIEEMYGLNFIGGSANATAIHGCWSNGFRMAAKTITDNSQIIPGENFSGWKVYPNPAYGEVHTMFELNEPASITISIYNNTGSFLDEIKYGELEKGNHIIDIPLKTKRYPPGTYYMQIMYGDKKQTQRFLIAK